MTTGSAEVEAGSPRGPLVLSRVVIRSAEIALILVGLGVVIATDQLELVYLAIWDTLAVAYVGLGVLLLRHSRTRPPLTSEQAPAPERFRFNFAFAIVSSITGVTVATDIATSDYSDDHTLLLNLLGFVAMVMSWMLLQAGYARRYAGLYRTNGGLTFPSTEHPAAVDFVYFAVTIGTAFSVSDVLVTTARMRWHVLVHSAVSLFYNAAVVAFALGLILGR